MTTNDGLHQRLRAQARGVHSSEAAAIILTDGVRGTLPAKLRSVIDDDPTDPTYRGMAYIDWDAAVERFCRGVLSGGERRLVELAASLAVGHQIDASDIFTGLDDFNGHVVLNAIAHCLRVQR